MKTTIDLPSDLVRQLKLRAVQDGRKLKDLAAEFLRAGLSIPSASNQPEPRIFKSTLTGLPAVQGRRAPGKQPTPEEIAQILADQEDEWIIRGGNGENT